MNIGNAIKTEILEAKVSATCCKRAFMSGVIRGAGSLHIERDGLGITIQHPQKELIDKCAELLYSLAKVSPEIIQKDKNRNLGNKIVYEINLEAQESYQLLQDFYIITAERLPRDAIPPALIKKDCCRKAYLRGIFVATGTISLAGEGTNASRGYFLELLVNSEGIANDLQVLLAKFDIPSKIRTRKNAFSVYIKNAEKICDFCVVLGANTALFALENILVERSLRNFTNRQVNCEMANIDRALDAAAKQVAAINVIKERRGLSSLDDTLKITAEIRLQYPNLSINDLLQYIPNPPTKSGLNHRLRKLIELANSIVEGEKL